MKRRIEKTWGQTDADAERDAELQRVCDCRQLDAGECSAIKGCGITEAEYLEGMQRTIEVER